MAVTALLIPLLFWAATLALKFSHPALYVELVQEDNVLELMQCCLYTIAAASALRLGLALREAGLRTAGVLHLLLAALLLLVALEEASWGQRLFGLETPAFFERHNRQHEISLHNLAPVHGRLHKLYLLAGLYGALGWLLSWPWRRQAGAGRCRLVDLVVPAWPACSGFAVLAAVYYCLVVYPAAVMPYLIARDQEPAETCLAWAVGVALWCNGQRLQQYMRLRGQDTPAQAAAGSAKA
ncbi:hypothetical protein [Ideonella livida]|uniref:Uncharacterized protein n=1 Tax=Ideonella livida TaxID=2707176 RepID=A0A7C9TNC2_9BURK|nr:hypothetical protein [Ideonella livida]NDY93944.1 hypothetical protein [Ideonella livida]